MTAKSLESLLNSARDGTLGGIVRRARQRADSTESLNAALPADLAEGVAAVNVRDGELVLIAASPEWAARLRFEADRVLAAAAAVGNPVETLTVRVARDV